MVRLVLVRLLETFFRHKWLYLLLIPVMAGAGVAYALLSKPEYQSRARLFVQDSVLISEISGVRSNGFGGSFYLTPAEITVEQFNELFKTDSYIRAIVRESNLEPRMAQGPEEVGKVMEEVREAIWAATDNGSTVNFGGDHVVILARHEDPAVAFQLVQGAVDNFIDWNINTDRSESADAAEFFASKVQTYKVDLDAATATMRQYLETHPEPLRGERPELEKLDISELQSVVDLAKTNYEETLQKYESATVASEQAIRDVQGTYTLLDAPEQAVEPERSITTILKDVIVFTALGGMLMAVAVLGSALIDRSIRFPIDIETRTGLPVLATIPNSDSGKKRRKSRKQRKKDNESKENSYYRGYA